MPPTFAYAMMLTAYVAFAVMVWLLAALLALPRRTRRLAKHIAMGMLGSFAGVFAYQVVGGPLVFLLLLVGGLAVRLLQPASASDVLLMVVALGTVGLFAAISAYGFYRGWRAGYRVAKGIPPKTALFDDPVVGRIVRWVGVRLGWA